MTSQCLALFHWCQVFFHQTALLEVRHGAGRTPLHCAAAEGHSASTKALLEAGANVNAFDAKNATPLYLAASGGYPRVAKILLKVKLASTRSDGSKDRLKWILIGLRL